MAAQDKGTGREQSIKITNTGGLSTSEIERMRQEAEKYAELDSRRIQLVELQNQADGLFYSYQTTIRENSDLIRDQLKLQIQEKKERLEAALKNSALKIEEINGILEDFRSSLLAVGSEVYQQAEQEQTAFEAVEDEEFETIEQEILSRLKKVAEAPTEQAELDFDYDKDETVTSDYEVID